jgi:hypothetical protein
VTLLTDLTTNDTNIRGSLCILVHCTIRTVQHRTRTLSLLLMVFFSELNAKFMKVMYITMSASYLIDIKVSGVNILHVLLSVFYSIQISLPLCLVV